MSTATMFCSCEDAELLVSPLGRDRRRDNFIYNFIGSTRRDPREEHPLIQSIISAATAAEGRAITRWPS